MEVASSGEALLEQLLALPGTRAHFVGVGGAGMAPLAAVTADRGWLVSGCDVAESEMTRELAARGIAVAHGHAGEHVAGVDLVVASSAVPPESPELMAAAAAGTPTVKRAELVGALTRSMRAVCVAGTHGKTTTTSMIALGLMAADADPSVLVGAAVPGIGVGGRSGSGDLLVVESDEYDGSFLRFRPHVAVVTNVEADHLDFYPDRASIDRAFEQFLSLVPTGGAAVVCADDEGSRRLAPAGAISYGLTTDATWCGLEPRPDEGGGMRFTAAGPRGRRLAVSLAVPGRHNVLNALAAIAVCDWLGADLDCVAEALAVFPGASRRFELKGMVGEVSVYDDYSHHPTEIRAALAAARLRASGRVWCVFQPHTYHRTRALFDDFAAAFGDADRVLLLDVYSPAGREPRIPEVSSERLASAMRHDGARYVPSFEAAIEAVATGARAGDLILTMGAGDVTRLGPPILARLESGRG